MRKPSSLIATLIALAWMACSGTATAVDAYIDADARSGWPAVYRVYFEHRAQSDALHRAFDVWSIDHRDGFLTVAVPDQATHRALAAHGLAMAIDDRHSAAYREALMGPPTPLRGDETTIPGFPCYATVEGAAARMQALLSAHPELVQITDIGDTWDKINGFGGYDLRLIELTRNNSVPNKPVLFIMSAIHAREYTTAELTTRFAEHLVNAYSAGDADVRWMLDHQRVQLLLHSNPDGRKHAEGGEFWRKNTNQDYCGMTSTSRGADMNRNFPFHWNTGTGECSDTFPGPSAASEPEIQALMTHLRNTFEDRRPADLSVAAPLDTAGIFIDVHSFSQLVMWPWGIVISDSPNHAQFRPLGRKLALFNGYTPQPINDLTIASGNSADTAYGELGVASFAFELGTQFFQDCGSFEGTIYPDNLNALMYALRLTRRPYMQGQGPDVVELNVTPSLVLSGDALNIDASISDDRYNHSNGNEPVQPVTGVTLHVDEVPWGGALGLTMQPQDGAFDSVDEQAQLALSTDTLGTGEHHLYLQASDTNGAGPVYAAAFHVVQAEDVANVSGRVTHAYTGEAVPQARVVIGPSNALTDVSGDYQTIALPGSSDILFSAEGFVDGVIAGVNLSAGQSAVHNIALNTICDVFADDMENGINGWSGDGGWAISSEQSTSPSHAWSDSPGGNYPNNHIATLLSPLLDVSEVSGLQLSFSHLCNTEEGFDFGRVSVNADGNGWEEVFACDDAAAWLTEQIDLSHLDGAAQLQLRFRLITDSLISDDGWYIDDVHLRGHGPACAALFNDVIFANGYEP